MPPENPDQTNQSGQSTPAQQQAGMGVQQSQQPQAKLGGEEEGGSIFKNIWFILFFVFVVLVSAGIVVYVLFISPKAGNSIVIADQPFGSSVHVDSLVLKQPAYLVIGKHERGEVTILARSPLLEPDSYSDFDLEFDEGVQVQKGEEIFATLYLDSDGDGRLDSLEDRELKNLEGNTLRNNFTLE